MSCRKVDPHESEAHCVYTSFHEYLIMIKDQVNGMSRMVLLWLKLMIGFSSRVQFKDKVC